MTRTKLAKMFNAWSGLDNSPGGLSWDEWRREGVTREAALNLVPDELDALRFEDLEPNAFIFRMDELWGNRCRALVSKAGAA